MAVEAREGDTLVPVPVPSGSTYKIKSMCLETAYDWLEIEDRVRSDRRKMFPEKLKFFVVEPKLDDATISGMKMADVSVLIREINRHNGFGDFTPRPGSSPSPTDGEDTTT